MGANPAIRLKLKARYLPILVGLLLVLQLLVPSKSWMILLVGLAGAWLISYRWARSLARGLELTREMRYGWIEFEPTAALPAIECPAGAVAKAPPAPEMQLESITAYRVRLNWALWLGVVAGLVLLAVAGVAIWSVVDGWRLRRLAPEAAVIDLYQRLRRHGRWLGVLSRKGDTPREYAVACVLRLAELMGRGRWDQVLVSAQGEVGCLAELCTRSLYSPWPTEATEQTQAIRSWRRLRGRL